MKSKFIGGRSARHYRNMGIPFDQSDCEVKKKKCECKDGPLLGLDLNYCCACKKPWILPEPDRGTGGYTRNKRIDSK